MIRDLLYGDVLRAVAVVQSVAHAQWVVVGGPTKVDVIELRIFNCLASFF